LKILVFTEGTILTHRDHIGLSREQIVELVKNIDHPLTKEYFADSAPIGKCVSKIQEWKQQGATITYLTSRRDPEEIEAIRDVLTKYHFPEGELLFRKGQETYGDVAEQASPDLIVEDDCESIGGKSEMTYPQIRPELKIRIKSVVVKEFGGIEHLPDSLIELFNLR
jgi:hypothetical protein